jgi:hypothetical protein
VLRRAIWSTRRWTTLGVDVLQPTAGQGASATQPSPLAADARARSRGNLTELALLRYHVANALPAPGRGLRFMVKSAHTHDAQRDDMSGVLR